MHDEAIFDDIPNELRPIDGLLVKWPGRYLESDAAEIVELRRLVQFGNDASNAVHFASKCRGVVVYDATDGGWRVFDGRRWERDGTGGIMRLAKAVVSELLRLATLIESDDARKSAVTYAIRLGGRRQLEAMIELAKSELPAIAADFDADPFTLNVENGILDLRTGALRDHDPAAYLTKLAPVTYHASAAAPRWERFLAEIFLGRADLICYVQRLVGYMLTADVSEHALPIAYGLGANGKSVFVGTLQKLLGDYALHADVSLFLARREHGATPELARLKGVRLVAASEMPEGGRLSENLIKSLTGGDRIAARELYGRFFEFTPTAKFVLATNYKPVVRGDDDGIWRRLKLIPFEASFNGADADRRLPEVLEGELPGILRWAVEGCLRWQLDGLLEPKPIAKAVAEYRSESDALGAFIDDRCVVRGECEARAIALGAAYKAWAEASNERPLPARALRAKIRERGFTERRSHGDVIFRGIGLRDEREAGAI